jgi:protein TonB
VPFAMKKIILKKKEKRVVKKVIEKPKKIVKQKRKKVEKIVKKRKVIEKTTKIKQELVKNIITQDLTPIVKKSTLISQAKKDYIKNEYIALLKRHIEKYKFYPKRAKRLRQEGKVIISFILSKNGKIKSAKIVQGCSSKRLNKAAIKLFDRITKFEPIPKELNKSSWNLSIPIEYSIINI